MLKRLFDRVSSVSPTKNSTPFKMQNFVYSRHSLYFRSVFNPFYLIMPNLKHRVPYLIPTVWFTLFCTFVLSTSSLFAQTTGKIAGRVTDASTGQPIPGATIRLEGSGRGNVADANGRYFIINVEARSYTVVASFVGYQTKKVASVRVSVDRTTEVNFQLAEEDTNTEVIVSAERNMVEKDRTSASAKVSGEEIALLPVDSFIKAVGLQAGITKDAGGGLHIRGGRSSEVKYYVDGVVVSNPFFNGLATPVENTAVQEVEVISGTFNAEYGQANSGIVNIVTKSGGDTFAGSFSSQVGGYISNRDNIFFNIKDAPLSGQQRFEGSISGPTGIKGLTFFANTTYSNRTGYFFGQRIFSPMDSSYFGGNQSAWKIVATGDSAIVPMSPSESMSNMGKLTYQLNKNIRLNYNLTHSWGKSKSYSHAQRLNPDSRPTTRSRSFNHLFSWNHVLDNRTFYNIRLTAYSTDVTQFVYEDPTDERYRALYGRAIQPSNTFATGGVDSGHLYRTSWTYAGRFDLTRQVGDTHLVKGGVEYRTNDMNLQSFGLVVDPRQYNDLKPHIPDVTTNRHNQYIGRKPTEIAAFIQDKIEIKDLIVNIGLRWDYFQANWKTPNDLRDPQNTLRPKPENEAYLPTSAKTQFSPRLGFAFPITQTGVIHASYGQFFQIPEFSRLYENPEFEVTLGNFNTFLGNADLDAQRSTIYEIGLQQQLGQNFVADVTAYYRDVRSLLGTELHATYTGADTYGRYTNRDFGNVRGIATAVSFQYPQIGFRGNVNYTYQSVRGNGSDPQQAFFDAQGNNEATRVLVPLDWDNRHTFNVDVSYSAKGFSFGTIGEFISGLPFTPSDINRKAIIELRNQARRNPEFRVDLRAGKNFKVGKVRLQAYLYAENIFDAYRTDRYARLFQSEIDAHLANGLGRINALPEYANNPAVHPSPRMVRGGLQFDF